MFICKIYHTILKVLENILPDIDQFAYPDFSWKLSERDYSLCATTACEVDVRYSWGQFSRGAFCSSFSLWAIDRSYVPNSENFSGGEGLDQQISLKLFLRSVLGTDVRACNF